MKHAASTTFLLLCAILAVAVVTPSYAQTEKAAPVAGEDQANISFSFKDKPWEDVLSWLADLSGRSLQIVDAPQGTFTYVDSKKYTLHEAIDIINSVLLDKGLVLLQRHNFLVVTNATNISPHLVERVTEDQLPKYGDTEFITILVTLRGLIAEEAEKEFEELMKPHGRIIPFKSTNQLMLVGAAKNIRQILKLIKENETDEASGELRVYPLKHVRAVVVERVVRDLLGLQPREQTGQTTTNNRSSDNDRRAAFMQMLQRRGGDRSRGEGDGPPGGPPQQQGGAVPGAPATPTAKSFVSVDTRTNTLFVTATPDKLALVDKAVQNMDVPQEGDEEQAPQTPVVRVYTVETGTADGLVTVLQTIFQNSPETRASAHPDGNALIVIATPMEHEKINEIIDQIKTEGLRVEVIALRTLDAAPVATLLKSVYGQGDSSSSQGFPFFFRSRSSSSNSDDKKKLTIEADTERNRLLVRGTDEQIREVRDVLASMGEFGVGVSGKAIDRGNFRVLQIGDNDPAEIGRRIEQAWSTLRPDTKMKVEVLADPRISSPQDIPRLRTPRNSTEEEEPRFRSRGRSRPETPSEDEPQQQEQGANSSSDENPLRPTSAEEPVQEEAQQPSQVPVEAPASQPETKPAAEPEEPAKLETDENKAQVEPAKPEESVSIVIGPTSIGITSTNPELANQMELLINSLLGPQSAGRPGFALYYLKAADAEDMAYLLDEAINGTRSLFSSSNSNLETRIIPDVRTNSLLVVGPPSEQRKVEEFLEYLDQEDPPETGVTPQPRMIQLRYADASEVAKVLKDVFAANLVNANQGNNQQRQGQNPFAMMFGGRSSRNNNDQAGKLTVGVEPQTNTLVISAPRALFVQVEETALALDDYAKDNQITTVVHELKSANPAAVQQALKNLFGVQTGDDKAKAQNQLPNGQNPGGPQGQQNSDMQSRFRSRSGDFGGGNRSRGGGGGRTGGGGFRR